MYLSPEFLTVGLSSVRREKGSYLLATLHSIFSQSSSAERSALLVVLLLADFDAQWRASTLGQITAEFTPQLELGQLLVIHAPQHYYPTLTGTHTHLHTHTTHTHTLLTTLLSRSEEELRRRPRQSDVPLQAERGLLLPVALQRPLEPLLPHAGG